MPLSMLGIGNQGIIKKYFLKNNTKNHFEGLGLLPGTKVKVLNEAGGNVIIIVKGVRLAMNKGLAQKFVVDVC